MNRIKLSGIYIIKHGPSGRFYIGMSRDIFSRWASHYNSMKMLSHSSTAFMDLWHSSSVTDWSFEVIEGYSFTKYKKDNMLRGQAAVSSFRTFLLGREKAVMGMYPKSFSLNKENKHFKV